MPFMLSAIIFSVTMICVVYDECSMFDATLSVVYDKCSMFDAILCVIIPSVIAVNVTALDAETKPGLNFINILRA